MELRMGNSDNVTEVAEGLVHEAFIVLARGVKGLELLSVLRVRVADIIKDGIPDCAPLRRYRVCFFPLDGVLLHVPYFTGSLGDDRARHLRCSVGNLRLFTVFAMGNTSYSRWDKLRWLPPAELIPETVLYTPFHTEAELRLCYRVIRLGLQSRLVRALFCSPPSTLEIEGMIAVTIPINTPVGSVSCRR
jgi:hypothetical protein